MTRASKSRHNRLGRLTPGTPFRRGWASQLPLLFFKSDVITMCPSSVYINSPLFPPSLHHTTVSKIRFFGCDRCFTHVLYNSSICVHIVVYLAISKPQHYPMMEVHTGYCQEHVQEAYR